MYVWDSVVLDGVEEYGIWESTHGMAQLTPAMQLVLYHVVAHNVMLCCVLVDRSFQGAAIAPTFCTIATRKQSCPLVFFTHRLCATGLEHVAPVNDDGLTVQVLVRSNEQHALTHVSVVTGPVRRNLALELLLGNLALLLVVALAGGHL